MIEETLTLFRHTKKPDWGTAVIAWERDGKRAYLFDSGMVKVLAEPFFRLMTPVEAESRELAARLAGHLNSGDKLASRTRTPATVRFSLPQQLALFLKEYDGGFGGSSWEKKSRGTLDGRRLKRHRVPAIADAQAKLGAEQLEKLAEEGKGSETVLLVCELLAQTDLVATAQTDALRKHADKADPNLPRVVHALLHSTNPEDTAPLFDDLVQLLTRMLGSVPSWELTTSLLALVRPGVHVCVRRSAFGRQADWILPEMNVTKQPSALGYAGYLRLAHEVNDKLTELGHAPDDLFDVHDFIKVTTTPAAQQRMQEEHDRPEDTKDDDTKPEDTNDDGDAEAA